MTIKSVTYFETDGVRSSNNGRIPRGCTISRPMFVFSFSSFSFDICNDHRVGLTPINIWKGCLTFCKISLIISYSDKKGTR
jgi:hypothetical protein